MLLTIKMPQNYQFIDNLIELRCTTNRSPRIPSAPPHVIEQLNHINALLVDQLEKQFVESLLQLREHYQTLHSQYQQKQFVPGSRSLM